MQQQYELITIDSELRKVTVDQLSTITSGLRFPEGPIALTDGTFLVSEMEGGAIRRVLPSGESSILATPGAGPNGSAVGPDGSLFVCNGGGYDWAEVDGRPLPLGDTPPTYQGGGRIERIDLESGSVEVLYDTCDGRRLTSPNDIVFDAFGGFYFTDSGKTTEEAREKSYLYYATADGSSITEITRKFLHANGVGLSPDGNVVYVAETDTGRLWALDVIRPGVLATGAGLLEPVGRCIGRAPLDQKLDSLAVDGEGFICVAAINPGGILRFSPDGQTKQFFPLPDPLTTNICFGGPNNTTAYVTLSSSGELAQFPWVTSGLRLAHNG